MATGHPVIGLVTTVTYSCEPGVIGKRPRFAWVRHVASSNITSFSLVIERLP